MGRSTTCFLAAAALLGASNYAAAATRPAPLQKIDAFVEQGLKDWQTPGLALAVVSKDQVVLTAGYGVREQGKPEKLDANSLVGIGSTSKAFGAAGVARLVQEGKVAYEDRVEKYLPWFQLKDEWVTHEVRVRDILSHRVGLDLSDENRLLAVAKDTKDFVRRLRYIEPAEPFRYSYVYSNAMFTTTGLLIEAASGKPWDTFIKDEIWTPLGMTRTGANLDVALADANHATPHVLVDGKLRVLAGWEPERNIFEVTGPSGAVISSAQDMAQWLRLQLGQGKYAGRQIIDQKIFQQMHTPHSPMRDTFGATSWFTHIPAADVKIGSQAYAMGWRTSSFRGRPMIWHGGTVTGFRTVVALLPEEQVAVFVNGSRESLLPFAIALTVFDAYLGKRDNDWSQLFLKERQAQEADDVADEKKRNAARIAGTKPSLPLDRYAGEYTDSGAFERLTVGHEGEKLVLTLGASVGDLEHWHYDVFRVHWRTPAPSESFATFVVDPAGKPGRLELARYGRFERREAGSAAR